MSQITFRILIILCYVQFVMLVEINLNTAKSVLAATHIKLPLVFKHRYFMILYFIVDSSMTCI